MCRTQFLPTVNQRHFLICVVDFNKFGTKRNKLVENHVSVSGISTVYFPSLSYIKPIYHICPGFSGSAECHGKFLVNPHGSRTLIHTIEELIFQKSKQVTCYGRKRRKCCLIMDTAWASGLRAAPSWAAHAVIRSLHHCLTFAPRCVRRAGCEPAAWHRNVWVVYWMREPSELLPLT